MNDAIISFICGIGASCVVVFLFKLLKPLVSISSKIVKRKNGRYQIKVVNKFFFPLKHVRYCLYLVKINGDIEFRRRRLTGTMRPTLQSLMQVITLDTLTKPHLETIRKFQPLDKTYLNAFELFFDLKTDDKKTNDLIESFLKGEDGLYLEFEFYCESTFSDATSIKYKRYQMEDIRPNSMFAHGNSCKIIKEK